MISFARSFVCPHIILGLKCMHSSWYRSHQPALCVTSDVDVLCYTPCALWGRRVKLPPASCKPVCRAVIQASRKMYAKTRASEHRREEMESLWPHFLHHWYAAWGPVVATAALFLNKAESFFHKGQRLQTHHCWDVIKGVVHLRFYHKTDPVPYCSALCAVLFLHLVNNLELNVYI